MNKILFILGASYIGGLERIAFDLIKGLKSNGFQTKCIINGWNDGTFRKMLKKENIDHTEIKIGSLYIHKPLWTLGTLYHYPAAIYQINRVIRDFQPDIVMHYSYRIFLMIYPVIRRCRNYFHVHERYQGFYYQKLSLPLMLKKVNHFIACSDFIRENLIKTGIEADKTITIHNGIEFKETGFIRKPGDIIEIGIVGQVIPRKGHHILIKALRIVHSDYSNFRLHIFGKGEENYVPILRDRSRPLSSRIRSCGMDSKKTGTGSIRNSIWWWCLPSMMNRLDYPPWNLLYTGSR